MKKTKEEIRTKWIRHTPLLPLDECVDNAMEEYASQCREDMANDINIKLDLLIGLCEKRISDCVVNKLNISEVDTQGMLFAYKTFKQYINKQD